MIRESKELAGSLVDGEVYGKVGIHKSLTLAMYSFAYTTIVVLTRLGQDRDILSLFLHLSTYPPKAKKNKTQGELFS